MVGFPTMVVFPTMSTKPLPLARLHQELYSTHASTGHVAPGALLHTPLVRDFHVKTSALIEQG